MNNVQIIKIITKIIKVLLKKLHLLPLKDAVEAIFTQVSRFILSVRTFCI